MTTPPAAQFLEQVKKREPAALEQLFRDVNPILFRVLAANGYRNELAEELAQQSWERFFTNLEKFEGRSSLTTFICGILFNKVREYRRANGRLVFEEDAEAFMQQSFSPEGWWNTELPDPSELLSSQQKARFIEECLDGLTELQKSAFLLKEVDQENSENICNILGIGASNLRVLIFRAKAKLRQCLSARLED